MENNPNCPQLDDSDYYKITQNDIMRLVNSQFIIVWHRGNISSDLPDTALPLPSDSSHLLYSLGPLLRQLVKLKILCIRIEYRLTVHYSMPIMKD